jgi:hypothetical protein
MYWYHWFAIAALAVCLSGFTFHLLRLIRLGKPRDYSAKAGNTTSAIIYSFTAAMSPKNKESAFLHLPTYTAGIIYHIATFLSIAVFFLLLFNLTPGSALSMLIIISAFTGTASGLWILGKRFADSKLRMLSNPDDYLSNMLVTLFQLFTGLVIMFPVIYPVYMVVSGLLLLYIPVGKLKHAIYFFAARYHLGFFYGWRNVWPPNKA